MSTPTRIYLVRNLLVDTDTGQTWSGRGLMPRWLREALGAGRVLADFLVEVAA